MYFHFPIFIGVLLIYFRSYDYREFLFVVSKMSSL